MYKIKKIELTDLLLARSSLCGDITGRGMWLTDNDDTALAVVFNILVPTVLNSLGINFTTTDSGWQILAETPSKPVVMSILTNRLLDWLANKGDDGGLAEQSDADPTLPPAIAPHLF